MKQKRKKKRKIQHMVQGCFKMHGMSTFNYILLELLNPFSEKCTFFIHLTHFLRNCWRYLAEIFTAYHPICTKTVDFFISLQSPPIFYKNYFSVLNLSKNLIFLKFFKKMVAFKVQLQKKLSILRKQCSLSQKKNYSLIINET